MDDRIAGISGQLNAQFASLLGAVPGLLTLAPNADHLMGLAKAMTAASFQAGASPLQSSYAQGIQHLLDAVARK